MYEDYEQYRSIKISDRAKALNKKSLTIDIHNHMMFEYAVRQQAYNEEGIFDKVFAPRLQTGGINVIATSVGSNSPCLCNLTDDLVQGSLEQIDMLRLEEQRSGSMVICCTVNEILETSEKGKTAVLMAFEGARAMEGLPGEESLVLLRTFYRLGLRVNCIVGAARTMFADGMGEADADAGLTTYGVKLVKEMNRIGMLIDLTHMSDRGFFDIMEITDKPVIVSHVGVQAVCDNQNNLNDEQVRAIGLNGGVICMEIVKSEVDKDAYLSGGRVDFNRVVDHIDHIVNLIGVDHVGLGLDFDNFTHVNNIHRAMCPAPGSIEGYYTGIPEGDHMLNEPKNDSEAYVIAEYLVKRGYSDADILKILGGNLLRVLSETIGYGDIEK